MGIIFGSFYTLAVYRIPRGQDITHTHSYCPNCNHKLGILDLIPVLSYIFLGAKCRYCKQKIRPRYFILEIISGLFFVTMAYLLDFSIYTLDKIKILEFSFLILYFTFIIIMAGIDKEYKKINKPVLIYGVIISIIYIVYLYIIDKASIYRYIMYLALYFILFLIDIIYLKKNKKDCYTYLILITLIIMCIFTGEYITVGTIILALLAISINTILQKLKYTNKDKQNNNQINIGLYLSIFNIIQLIVVLTYLKLT